MMNVFRCRITFLKNIQTPAAFRLASFDEQCWARVTSGLLQLSGDHTEGSKSESIILTCVCAVSDIARVSLRILHDYLTNQELCSDDVDDPMHMLSDLKVSTILEC